MCLGPRLGLRLRLSLTALLGAPDMVQAHSVAAKYHVRGLVVGVPVHGDVGDISPTIHGWSMVEGGRCCASNQVDQSIYRSRTSIPRIQLELEQLWRASRVEISESGFGFLRGSLSVLPRA